MVAASDNLSYPFLGSVMKGIEAIIVRRNVGSGSNASDVFDAIRSRATGKNGLHTQVLIFPEGECAWDRWLLERQSAHTHVGAHIPFPRVSALGLAGC